MLKKHSKFFENLLLFSDMVIIAASLLFSYYIRFYSGLVPVTKGIPGIKFYVMGLVPIIIIWAFAFKSFGLYRPKRVSSHISEIIDIAKASIVASVAFMAALFFMRYTDFSRLVLVLFTVVNITALSFSRAVFREVLRYFRRRGYNQRQAIVAGGGELASGLVEKIRNHPELGINIKGFVAGEGGGNGASPSVARLGGYADIAGVIKDSKIDIVFIALPWEEHSMLVEVLKNIGDEAVDIKVVPDLFELITLGGGIEEFDGLPIMSLQGSKLYGWNVFIKRAFDVVCSVGLIVFFAPPMLLIAVLIKLSSPGPIFYRQERMSIGGDTFTMLKFRSMRIDAEEKTGAVWASAEDDRKTRLGAFLRKTSLDELPQLFNVLKGDMSLVGPRPERPVFIDSFRKNIPRYMLRHKMKAGITGWAQINGLRGNTDLGQRIDYDIYYIENWSLALDIKILVMTLFKGFVNRNAY